MKKIKKELEALSWDGGSGEIDDIIAELVTLKEAGATYIDHEYNYGEAYWIVMRDETAEEYQARVLVEKMKEDEKAKAKLEKAKLAAERKHQQYLKLKAEFEDKK